MRRPTRVLRNDEPILKNPIPRDLLRPRWFPQTAGQPGALQTATLLPAKAFGVGNDLGTIEPGKLADLVLVAGNPLANIKDAANVRMLMKNGQLYAVSELVAPFAR